MRRTSNRDTNGDSEPGGIAVLAGDLGAVPESATMRFLTGLDIAGADGAAGNTPAYSTYWVDAWDVAGIGPSTTTGPDNPWTARAAQDAGVEVRMVFAPYLPMYAEKITNLDEIIRQPALNARDRLAQRHVVVVRTIALQLVEL